METITTLHEKLKNRTITATQLVQKQFAAINALNPALNVFLHTNEQQALEKASVIDKGYDDGKELPVFAGIPFSTKDAFNVQSVPTQTASKVLEGYIAPYTATPIAKLEEQGAIFLGKNNQDAFGFGSSTENSDYGVVRNPWDEEKVAGGSSGGSAAAVAADMSVFTIGEDTGGSIRLPANFCGVTGLKVTYGRVSRYGAIAFASSLDTVGPIAHSVEDVAMILSVIAGKDPHDATTLPVDVPDYHASINDGDITNLKIGVPAEMIDASVDSQIRDAFEESLSVFESLGAEIIEIQLSTLKYGVGAYYITAPSEASSNLSRFDGIRYGYSDRTGTSLDDIYFSSKTAGFNDEAKRRIMLGTYALSSGYYDAYFDKAQKIRTLMKEDFDTAFRKVDCIMGPVAPTLPFTVGEKVSDPLSLWLVDAFTIPVNIAGIPSLALPNGISKEGLPLGFQIMGPQLSEALLLQIGHMFQQETDWHERRPDLVASK